MFWLLKWLVSPPRLVRLRRLSQDHAVGDHCTGVGPVGESLRFVCREWLAFARHGGAFAWVVGDNNFVQPAAGSVTRHDERIIGPLQLRQVRE